MKVLCQVSIGELVDKVSILMIKEKKINDPEKLIHVKAEMQELLKILDALNLGALPAHLEEMVEINEKLWEIEDQIRLKEKANLFDQSFIDLARAVYVSNDERFKRKNAINELYGSEIKEVKSYEDY